MNCPSWYLTAGCGSLLDMRLWDVGKIREPAAFPHPSPSPRCAFISKTRHKCRTWYSLLEMFSESRKVPRFLLFMLQKVKFIPKNSVLIVVLFFKFPLEIILGCCSNKKVTFVSRTPTNISFTPPACYST